MTTSASETKTIMVIVCSVTADALGGAVKYGDVEQVVSIGGL